MNTTGEAYGRVARTELTPEELERIVEEVGEEVIEVAPVETQGYATVGEIDMSHNAERKAYEIADRRVEELKKQNEKRFIFNPKRIVRTIWGFKGTHRSLLNQAREDIRQAGDVNAIDEGFDARARRRYGEAICEQFFNGSEEAIDTVAGEKREFFADNHEATVEARQLYVEFAESDSMSDDEFNSRLQEVRRKMGESLSDTATGEVVLDNYLEVARAMRGRRQHGEAMDSVAEGFRLMRGEARSDSRTEIHRTKVDKALDRYEDSRFGNIIPSQVLAAGISVGAWLATRGASTIARATAFVGGGAVIGAVVGAREHAEITSQRAMRERETFRGKEYEDGTRRERELSEFEYNRRNVDVILSDLNESLEQLRGGDFGKRAIDATLDRLAEVQTLKDMSAELGIDLFDHGVSDDPTKHLTDRMSIAEAQAELKVLIAQAIESGDTDTLDAFGITDINMVGDPAEFLDEMLARRSEAFAEVHAADVSAKDEAFRKYRRRESLKKGLKVGALSMVAGVAIQEAISMASSDSAGLVEQAWGGNDNIGAHNTMLGALHPSEQFTTDMVTRELSPQEIADLRAGGSTVIDHSTTSTKVIPGTESLQNYVDQLPHGEMRRFSSVELYTNNYPSYSDLNELGGQLSYSSDGSGNVSPWDTMKADGSFNTNGSIDMVAGPNVFDIAIKQPDGTHLHKIFEYGQDVPRPWADMLYQKSDETWGFKGKGYIAWGQTSGGHLDVAASIRGDGDPVFIDTTRTIEEVVPKYEVITPVDTKTDFAPPIWFSQTERLGNARRRSPERYGYSGISGGYTERQRDADVFEQMSRDWSPAIQENPEADLSPAEEFERYEDLLERRRPASEVDEIKKKIAGTPELNKIAEELETIVTVPVGAQFESDNIFNTLALYARQDSSSLNKTIIMLNVNWLDTAEADPVVMDNIRKTLAEIERARRSFPQLKIAVVQNTYSEELVSRTGGVIGYVAQDLIDTALLTLNEAQKRGDIAGDSRVLIQRHDADMKGMSYRHLSSLQAAAKKNPQTDLFKGSTKLGVESSDNNPGWGVIGDMFDIASTWATRAGRVHTGGANFAVRAEALAAAGGINAQEYSGVASDDVAIGDKISLMRSGSRRVQARQSLGYRYRSSNFDRGKDTYESELTSGSSRVVMKHVVGMVIDTNSDRFLSEYMKGKHWGMVWNPGGSFGDGSGGYGSRVASKRDVTKREARREKYGKLNRADFDRLEVAMSHELSYMDEVSRRRLLSMFFRDAPGAYDIRTSSDGEIRFTLTPSGRKFVGSHLGKKGSYRRRKQEGMYGNSEGLTVLGKRAILA